MKRVNSASKSTPAGYMNEGAMLFVVAGGANTENAVFFGPIYIALLRLCKRYNLDGAVN